MTDFAIPFYNFMVININFAIILLLPQITRMFKTSRYNYSNVLQVLLKILLFPIFIVIRG